MAIVFEEFRSGIRVWRYIVYRAYLARKLIVARSSLGLLFEPILLVASTFCIALVWNKIFGRGGGQEFFHFFLYVLVSFSIWNLISSVINGSSGSLLGRVNLITNTQDPILVGILMDLVGCGIIFLMSLPAVLVFILLLSKGSLLGFAYLAYGFLLIFVTGIGCGLTIGVACLFVGDLRAIINAIMRVSFLLTPVIWQVERLGEYQKYIYWNPFYNYLAICRDGLLKGDVGTKELIIATSMTITIFLLGLLVLSRFKIRLRKKAFSL